MAEEETWTLSLKDMMSGPAASMATSLRALDVAQTMAAASGNALAKIPPPRGADGKFLQKGSDAWREAMAAAQGGAAGVAAAGQAAGAATQAAGASMASGAADAKAAFELLRHPVDAAAFALSKMGPEGEAAAGALKLVDAAIDASVGKLLEWGEKAIQVTERTAAMRAAWAGLAGGAEAGKALQASISGLNLPFAGSEVNKWAATLTAAGVKGKQLEAELRAVASAQALGGPLGETWGAGAEEFFKKMGAGGNEANEVLKKIQKGGRAGAEALKAMGLNIEDVGGQAAVAKMSADQLTAAATKALQLKGGPSLEALGNTWDVIKMKAAAGFSSVFSGLAAAGGPVETFMQAVKSIGAEFSKGGVAVNVLKPIVTAVFTKLFAVATWALGAIHKGFLYLVIGGLTAYIALRPIIKAITDIATSANMLRGAAIIFGLLALPFVLMAAVMLVVVGTIGAVIGIVLALAAAFVYVVGAVASFVGSIGSAFADAYSAATGAGGSIVDGLVAGVTAGAGAFMGALSGLASQGLAAFKGIFAIASPSAVMLEHGEDNIAGAAATGVDKGADKMDASMAKLGSGPKGGGKGGKDGGKEGKTIVFDHCIFGEGVTQGTIFEMVWMALRELDAEA